MSENARPFPESPAAPEFQPGDMVRLKAHPERQGAVVAVVPGSPECRYTVFMEGGPQTFYASQLQADRPERPDPEILPAERFHARLSALHLKGKQFYNVD